MSGVRPLIVCASVAVLLGGRALPALAQDPQPAAAPAPAAPAVDSNMMYVGDWDFTAQLRDSTIAGMADQLCERRVHGHRRPARRAAGTDPLAHRAKPLP